MESGNHQTLFVYEMEQTNQELTIEYLFSPSPDAEEQWQQAIDLILDLILEDLQNELAQEGETC